MTEALAELNRTICALKGWTREDWDHPSYEYCDHCTAGGKHEGWREDTGHYLGHLRNWHDDRFWPTLMREMQAAGDFNLLIDTEDDKHISVWFPHAEYGLGYEYNNYDLASAICRSWIEWKEQSAE